MDGRRRLSQAFAESHPEDAARLLEGLPSADAAGFLENIPPSIAAGVLGAMSPAIGSASFGRLSIHHAAAILPLLAPYAAAALLRHLDDGARRGCLAALPEETARTLEVLLRHPDHTAGALMDAQIATVEIDADVRTARTQVRRLADRLHYYLYVVDRSMKLSGVLTLRRLYASAPDAPLRSVMISSVARLPASADRGVILAHPGWRRLHTLPVVDEEERLLGVIRYETVRHLEREARAARSAVRWDRTALEVAGLYWIALVGLAQGLLMIAWPRPRGTGRTENGA